MTTQMSKSSLRIYKFSVSSTLSAIDQQEFTVTPDLDYITSAVRDNEDMQFLWSILSVAWEESGSLLL